MHSLNKNESLGAVSAVTYIMISPKRQPAAAAWAVPPSRLGSARRSDRARNSRSNLAAPERV